MGAVLKQAGTIKASELGGLYKSMPWSASFCIVGAASISAFPLTSGFVAKSMILTAAAEEHHMIAFLVLLFASAGVAEHSGIKIPFFGFFGHDHGLWKKVKEAPLPMLAAMAGAAALCLGIGIWPQPLYSLLPFEVDFQPYTTSHVVTQLQLLLFAVLAFVWLWKARLYPDEERSTNLDFDWVYRKALPRILEPLGAAYSLGAAKANRLAGWAGRGARSAIARQWGPEGLWGEPWPTGRTSMWAAILLVVYLVFYYI
jgi:multicomponent Na+:H+ antiporter subunit D